MSTRSITAVPYIVVLDAAPSTVRALLFDCEARVVEGFGARLPHRKGAAEDCLEEVERQARESGFRVASVVGRDCPISDLARLCLGTGCLSPKRFALTIGEISALATMQGETALGEVVPDAAAAYPAVKRALGITGSIEARLETAADDDPGIAPLRDVVRRFREIYDGLSTQFGTPEEIVISGAALLKSPAWTQMFANGLARPVVVCTEPDPFARGAALWALKQTGVIGEFSDLPASMGAVFLPQEHFSERPSSEKSTNYTMNPDIQALASRVRLLLMDVDGVLTDAKLYNVPGPNGTVWETKAFDAQDGIALQWLNWYDIETGVISGRVSPATEERARQVKMKHVYQGHIEKIPILEQIIANSGISLSETAYIGDDLTDVVVMRRVALAIAPANARPEVKKAAHFVTTAAGGAGAVREVAELLLQAHGKWPEILKKYEIQ